LILIILFLIGLPLHRMSKKEKTEMSKEQETQKIKSQFEISSLIANRKFLFMEDYRMWKSLTEPERKERLTDIQVIFDHGKDLLTKEMIKQGFQTGSKIIDIKYFTGLNEFGFTITSFLIQHENGGEIRALTVNIDMDKMIFTATNNRFHSNGKEKYWYLKDMNKDLMQI